MSKIIYNALKDPKASVKEAYNVAVDTVANPATKVAGLLEMDWMSLRAVPHSPDGLHDDEADPASDFTTQKHSEALTIVTRLLEILRKGVPMKPDYQTIMALVDALKNSNWKGLNDRKMLMEKVLVCAARLPNGTRAAAMMNDLMVELLYKDLPHPVSTYVGQKYMFRTADGSYNNIVNPDIGKAGMPYARSVTPMHAMPPSELPDPALIFDTLLRREEPSHPHPAGISSLFFTFATTIIHCLFRTRHTNGEMHINDTSSYLDMSVLYGCNQEAQDTVRKKDGRGKLYEDVYAENRVHMLPPAVSALLILFCRNHNYIAEKLLQINERGTWKDPNLLDKDQTLKQDDEIFNTARLVNCGFFMNIILTDYLNAILGLVREGSEWCLDPLQFIRTQGHDLLERGTGNTCSVEFNLLYRFHAPTSLEDEKWTEELFGELFPDEKWDEITFNGFVSRVANINIDGQDPRDATLNRQQRDPHTGKFSDDLLAGILQDATEHAAQAFKARGTPSVFRVIEILGIREARAWGVCTLNEFRKFLGLTTYKSFKEWNGDPDIAQAAEMLYKHVDNLELYPGLQAEEAKPVEDGTGLCPGYTISRAILADAVALTRGDRHLTTDFTPQALTAFGYQDCARTTDNGSFGGTLGRLLFRHLPNHYHEGDVYAHFPMMVPSKMEGYLKQLNKAQNYNFKRPVKTPEMKAINTLEAAKKVLADFRAYKVTYPKNMKYLSNGYGFFLAFDDPAKNHRDRQMVQDALFPDANAFNVMAKYFFEKTSSLIREKSYSLSGHTDRCVDIVRDVINLVPVHWVSKYISGLPIKTKEDPHAPFDEQKAYDIYMVIFTFIFLNIQPEYGWFLRTNAKQAAEALLFNVELHLKALKPSLINPFKIIDDVKHAFWGEDKDCHSFLRRLIQTGGEGRPLDELAYNVLGVSCASVANYAHACVQVVNLYLDDKYKAERDDIIRISRMDNYGPQEEKLLEGYVLEAMRLDPQAPGIFREVATPGTIMDGEREIQVQKGDRLFVSLKNAMEEPTLFEDPVKINPCRPRENYMSFGSGMHTCLGNDFVIKTMPSMLRAIFSLKGLKRGPGKSGQLNRFPQDLFGTTQYMYLNATGMPTPWPVSMVVQYSVE